jgi:iron complex outermembrane receptor protein
MRLIEEVHSKLTILSVREWESFQTILRSMARRCTRTKVERSKSSGEMSKKFLGMAIMLAILLVVATRVQAMVDNGEEVVSTMAEVVVTATRSEQDPQKVPAAVSVITAEEIAASNADTIPDLLRILPGVMVRDVSGNGNNQMVDIGGFGETADRHVAVVVNGRRINPIDMGTVNWSSIPIENVERVEVLYGSGTVLYGDNAMGGVINIITKEPVEEGMHARIDVSTGSYDSLKESAGIDYVSEKTSVTSGFERQKTNGYRDNSALERDSFYADFRYDPADSTSIFLNTSIGKAEYELPGALTSAQLATDREQTVYPDDAGNDQDVAVVLGIEHRMGQLGNLILDLSYRQQDREADMVSWVTYMIFDVTTLGLNPRYVLDSSISGRDNRLTVGVDYYDTGYDGWTGATKGAKTSHNDFSRETLAIYAQDELNITGSLLVNIGGRYEKSEYSLVDNFSSNATSEEEMACNLGLVYSFNPGTRVFARTYRSFRYPVVDEYITWGAFNPTLRPETARGYELGGSWSVGSLGLNLRAYLMDVDDEIAYDFLTSLNQNMEGTRHTGIDLSVGYDPFEKVGITAGISLTDAEFSEGANDGFKVPLVAEVQGSIGLELKPVDTVKASVRYIYVGERYAGGDFANMYSKLPAHDTVDLFVSYGLSDKVEVFANAKNIFGEEYSELAFDYGFFDAFYPMPEASYFAGIRFNL